MSKSEEYNFHDEGVIMGKFEESTTINEKIPGEILHQRYIVQRLIGEGGFGIVYEAIDNRKNKRVALKQLKRFRIRTASERRIAAIEDYQKKQKDNFLREACILRTFSDDPAVVKIFDTFEDNETAFIVMEFLDGITLSEDVQKHGFWSIEKAAQAFIPIMKVLERIHLKGVIHRDISPDNLMLMPDGTLRLMDFGATKDLFAQGFSQNAFYKSCYSPYEQHEVGGTLGVYSDVYSLCATFYYCITGVEPPDALSRVYYDELKAPSKIIQENHLDEASITTDVEKCLLKGMAVSSAERIPSVTIFRELLESEYPNLEGLSEKEIKRIRSKNRFSRIEKQEFYFLGNSINKDDFLTCADVVHKRIEAFAGADNYQWEEKGEEIRVELPLDLLNGMHPKNLMEMAITRRMVLSVEIRTSDGNWRNLGVFSQVNDMTLSEYIGNEIKIIFNNKSKDRFEGILDIPDQEIQIVFDRDEICYCYWNYWGRTVGDGNTVIIKADSSPCKISDQLIRLHLTHEPIKKPFVVVYEWKNIWENINDGKVHGKYQVNQECVSGRCISVHYTYDDEKQGLADQYDLSYIFDQNLGFDTSFFEFKTLIQNRLDAMEIPYAIGVDYYDNKTYVLKLPADKIYMEEIANLGRYIRGDFHIGVTEDSSNELLLVFYDLKIIEKENRFELSVELDDDMSQRGVEILQNNAADGKNKLYLYFCHESIAYSLSETIFQDLRETNCARFIKWTSKTNPEMNETTRHFAEFLISALHNKHPKNDYYADFSMFEIQDGEDKKYISYGSDLLPGWLSYSDEHSH